MKKLLFISFSFIWFVPFVQAQIAIPYLNSSPVIDGLADDWDLTKMTPYISRAKHVLSVNRVIYQLGFDEQNLYGIFKITDQHLTDLALDKSGSTRLNFNDAIELYIDAKNNSNTMMDASDYQIIIDLNAHVTVFRGGDRFLVQVEEASVPKDTITNSFVIETQSIKQGTINKDNDTDEGYVIEFRLPWASLGNSPSKGTVFKMDICFDDADEFLDIRPLPETSPIPHYSYESITGNSDFGYPEKWLRAKLVGEATWWKKLNQKYSHYWLILASIMGFVFIPLTIYLSIKNFKLKNIRPKSVDVDRKLASILQETKKKDIESKNERLFVKQAKLYIMAHLDTDITPLSLANELGVSLRHLQRIFKEELDITPTTFITTLKMEEAAVLLKNPDKNISEVAYAIGFSDPAYFAKVFKKYFNVSPKEFIRQLTQKP